MNTYFEYDYESFGNDFLTQYYVRNSECLLRYLEGHFYRYNGTFYEALTWGTNQLKPIKQEVREFCKTISFVDRKGKATKVPSSPAFFKSFFETLCDLCEVDEIAQQVFKQPNPDLVFGKTKVYRISTDTFEPYSPSHHNTFVLNFDVAEEDKEPDVWKEFFAAAGMDEDQQRSWWYTLNG